MKNQKNNWGIPSHYMVETDGHKMEYWQPYNLSRPRDEEHARLLHEMYEDNHKFFYITTAISYPNGSPHIGHVYEAVVADAFARFKRLDGYGVHFVTGTDDHGQKIHRMANEQNTTPQELTDRLSTKFKKMCDHFSVSYDRFIRTSEPSHHTAVYDIWKKMEARGDIYRGKYKGFYSVREERFYTESEVSTGAGIPVEWVEEESYFFRLSAYQERLLEYYEKNPAFIRLNSHRNEMVSFVKGGLKDLAISRSSFDWGVASPHEGHIVYVWLDALVNYLTAVGYPDIDTKEYKRFWPADVHIIGKDILKFHAVYWPAFLMSADLPIPKKICAHGMILTGEGKKMSKSLDNALDPYMLADTYGVDQLRYFLLSDIPFGFDGACGKVQIKHRLDANLANNLGNLAHRSLTMIQNEWGGKVPPVASIRNEKERALLLHFDSLLNLVRKSMNKQMPNQAIASIFVIVSLTNRYFAEMQAWKLEKTEQGRVLYITLDVLRRVAILLQPFMPNDMAKLLDYLGVKEYP